MILTEKETYWAANKLTTYFNSFERIDEYMRIKKLERIKDHPTGLFGMGPEDDLFQQFDMHPKDMEFEIVTRTRETFDRLLEITSSFTNDDPPARVTRLCVQEKNTNKIVGFIKFGSPLINAKPRNDWLGQPMQKEMLPRFNQGCIMGFVIVPAQPFGFNYLGGKLLSALCTSHYSREMLNKKYGGPFCLFETTSLYGNIKGMSQYDGMKPLLKYRGDTVSNMLMTFGDDVYFEMRDFFYEKNGGPMVETLTDKGTPVTGHKLRTQNKMISIISNNLKEHNSEAHKKFVEFRKTQESITTQKRFYNSSYGYTNSREYMLGETDELIKGDLWDRHELENVIKWWRKKATKRYESLKKDGRLRTKIEVWKKDNMDSIDIIR